MKEIWKDVVDYKGIYLVSNKGRIKSLKFSKKGKFLRQTLQKNGYLYVGLTLKGITSIRTVHSIMADSFFGINPNLVTDHINNIKTDNRIENLQRITARENSSKDRKNKTSKYTGVWWVKSRKRWNSQIWIGDIQKNLGYFINEEDAAKAYNAAKTNLLNLI